MTINNYITKQYVEMSFLLWYTHLRIWLFKAPLLHEGHMGLRIKISGTMLLSCCKNVIYILNTSLSAYDTQTISTKLKKLYSCKIKGLLFVGIGL
jgi:hypothetical protein